MHDDRDDLDKLERTLPELLRVDEVATIFRCSKETVRRWGRQDPPKLDSRRTPMGRKLYTRASVIAVLRGGVSDAQEGDGNGQSDEEAS